MEQNLTPPETGTGEPHFHDVAGDAYDELTSGESTTDPEAVTEGPEEISVSEEDVAQAIDAQEEAQQEAQAEGEQAEQADQNEVLFAPETWPQEWKDEFKKLGDDPNTRGFQRKLLEINGNMQRDYTHKSMQLAEARRGLGTITEAVTPHADRLHRAGIEPGTAVSRALAWDAHMQNDPMQGILDYAQAYGVDLNQVVQTSEQNEQYMTPTERAMKQELDEMRRMIGGTQQQMTQRDQMQQNAEWQQRYQHAGNYLQGFMSEADEAGEPKHPFVQHVAPQMVALMNSRMATNLNDAYEQACYMHPQVREHLISVRQARKVQESKSKAASVKAASAAGALSNSGGKPEADAKSFEQMAADAYDKAANS